MCAVAWMDWTPGNFVSVTSRTGIVRVWNVSQKQPLELLRVKRCGFSHLSFLPNRYVFPACCSYCHPLPTLVCTQLPASALCAASWTAAWACFTWASTSWSGKARRATLCVAPPSSAAISFRTACRRPLHALIFRACAQETIFDVAYAPSDPDELATCSYDGSVKLWNTAHVSCTDTLTVFAAAHTTGGCIALSAHARCARAKMESCTDCLGRHRLSASSPQCHPPARCSFGTCAPAGPSSKPLITRK